MSVKFPDNRGIPLGIGRAVKNGILITKDSYFPLNNWDNRCPQMTILNACRTVLGGPVKVMNPRQVCINVKKKRKRVESDYYNGYMVVPDAFARLIVQYGHMAQQNSSMNAYAGLSLQEFLMRTWGSSDSQ